MPLLVLFFSLMSAMAEAQILIQSPEADMTEYQTYLNSNPQGRSYSQSVISKLTSSASGTDEVFQLADQSPQSIQDFEAQLAAIRQEKVLSITAWSFVADFLAAQKDRYERQDPKKFRNLVCAAQFFANQEIGSVCVWKSLSLERISTTYPRFSMLSLDGKVYELKGDLLIPFDLDMKWMLISDSYKEQSAWGKMEDILQIAKPEPLVVGGCSHFTPQVQDFTVLNTANIFFSKDCIKPLNTDQSSKPSWVARNSRWLIPVGIILAGAAAAYQLRDKKLVIKNF